MSPLRVMRPEETAAVLERHRHLFDDSTRSRIFALTGPLGFFAFTAFAIWWLAIPFDQILQGLAWLEQRVQTGRKVYIHCAAGMGRSVTLLACWYLYTESMTVSQVLAFVKRRRPQTSLTRRQVRRIREIAILLTHTAGKLPIKTLH